jgi:hypothetical protein
MSASRCLRVVFIGITRGNARGSGNRPGAISDQIVTRQTPSSFSRNRLPLPVPVKRPTSARVRASSVKRTDPTLTEDP